MNWLLKSIQEKLEDHGFFGALSDALATFQRRHELPVTGVADKVTLTALNAPRFCGCPDQITVEGLNRWPDPVIYYGFSNNWPSHIDMKKVQESVQWAGDQWSGVCNVKFIYAPGPDWPSEAKSRMLIKAERIDGKNGVLGESQLANNQSGEKWQRYDISEEWDFSTTPSQFQISLPYTMRHEIGHFIGIPHIGNGNVMQPMYDSRFRSLQAGDIREAVSRYGPPIQNPSNPSNPSREFLIKVVGSVDKIIVPPGVSISVG